jgi:hypothetical protein
MFDNNQVWLAVVMTVCIFTLLINGMLLSAAARYFHQCEAIYNKNLRIAKAITKKLPRR